MLPALPSGTPKCGQLSAWREGERRKGKRQFRAMADTVGQLDTVSAGIDTTGLVNANRQTKFRVRGTKDMRCW